MPKRRAQLAMTGAVSALGVSLFAAAPASAVNYVTTANGATWGVHDAAAPSLDTGSIRDITGNAFYGFGGIRVSVPGIQASDPTATHNGELMRGFGLEFDGVDSFDTTEAVTLGGIKVRRAVKLDKAGNYARFFDSFTNTTDRVITVEVAFGGTAGLNTTATSQGVTTSSQAKVAATGSGDKVIDPADAWVELASPPAGAADGSVGPSSRGPSAVVLGTPPPGANLFQTVGNFQRQPFTTQLASAGLEANFFGFKSTVTLVPGQTKSLLRFVVAGRAETGATSGQQITAVGQTAATLSTSPSLAGLTVGEICSLSNWTPASLPGYDAAACAAAKTPEVRAQRPATLATTISPYDVVGKSITEMADDMASGKTTSQQITRAYLDRIAAYDTGQFGFHSFITVAKDAMAQAKAADEKRAKGEGGDLLGIPMAIKDLYDTKDMPTTDGTLALDGWRPKTDAFQVARLRAAGAVILGKTNLSEFANSGSYSESGYGMVWNAFNPSKTSLGSSGGSAVATALSLAGASMGTQTGVSLFAPSTGASLVTLRGTDGISSGAGVMPLTYLQDFEGPIARTTSDVARILNVTTGTDPDDPATVAAKADEKRPADWKTSLDEDALKGKRIGYIEASFTGSPALGQDDGTMAAMKAKFADIQAAGATMVEMSGGLPAGPANIDFAGRSRTEEGWQAYWDRHPEGPFSTASGILSSAKNLPYNRRTLAPAPRLTKDDVGAIISSRDAAKARFKTWLDTNGVDAVVYPGFRSDVYDNDGAQTLSSDRNSGYPTSSHGVPTLVLPVGANPHGDPMSLQFVGRAFDDAKVLGIGYALEQHLKGEGRLTPATAPALAYDATATADPIVIDKPQEPETVPPVTELPEETRPNPTPAPTPVPPVPFSGVAPSPVVTPTIKVTFPTGAKLKGTRVKVVVKNTGTAPVVGTVVLRGTVTTKGKRSTKTFGSAKLSLATGQQRTASVTLNATGRKALAAKSTARVTASYVLTTAPAASSTTKTTLTLKR
ncbi:MAG: amidase [Solirubrobacteraceae bacterium]|nr:amidase [Solirubrobacteraceae bacterium]